MSDQEPPYNPFTRPKFAALERLVCSYLIESLAAQPLEAVIFICRAGMLLTDDEVKKLDLDMKAINSVYTLAERFQATKGGALESSRDSYSVNLRGLDFEYDIKSWLRSLRISHWPYGLPDIDELTLEERILTISTRLSHSGYMSMRSDFLQMSTPFAQSLGGRLTSLINPETYTDMLQTYKGVKNA